jgi:DnaJ-domain-containing protein 1
MKADSITKRKLDTRHKIELGGLVIKSKIIEMFEREFEQFKTKDEKFNSQALVLGALLSVCNSIKDDPVTIYKEYTKLGIESLNDKTKKETKQ